MIRAMLSVTALALLTACGDGNPFTDSTGDNPAPDSSTNSIPEVLAKNLQSVTYDPSTSTLQLNMTGLDAGPAVANYVRKPALDIGSLKAYTFQNSGSERHFTALTDQVTVPGGTAQATVVGDGGQFGVYYSGGGYAKTGVYSPKVGGTTKYLGSYAGVTNLDDPGSDLTPPPASLGTAAHPAQSATTAGTIFLTANFSDSLVNGAIYSRTLVRDGTVLPNIDLSSGVIAADGTFLGGAGYDGKTPGAIGSFGGTFAGTNSTAIAGVVTLDQFFDDGSIAGGQEREQGVFVLIECGQPGGAASC